MKNPSRVGLGALEAIIQLLIFPRLFVKKIRIVRDLIWSYNYHHRKLYRLMEGNTCAIQAQVKDVMLDTLDCLV
mgnify:CR=1|jgi:hypothetical protein